MDEHEDIPTGVRMIEASIFKENCLALLDQVSESGTEIVVTRNGRPVARLVP